MESKNKKEILRGIAGLFEKSDISDEYLLWDVALESYTEGNKELEIEAYNLLKIFNDAISTSKDNIKEYMKQHIDDDSLVCYLDDLYIDDKLYYKKLKFLCIIKEFHYSETTNEMVVSDRTVKNIAKGDKEVELKAHNVLKMFNTAIKTSDEAVKIFADRDIEDDLWYAV